MRNVIPVEVKRKCIELSNQGLTAKEIYTQYYSEEFDTKFSGFKRMLRKWKKKIQTDEEILDTGNLMYGYTPHATTVQVNANNEIVQTWVKSKAEDRLFLELIENIQKLPEAEPVKRRNKPVTHKMLQIPFDDMRFGIAFFEDYEESLIKTLTLIESEQWEEINIVIGADLLHTDDLKGHTSNQTYIGEIDIKRAYNDSLRFYYEIMESSLKCSEKVNVIYNRGNHSETLSWTIIQVLKVKYPEANYEDSFDYRKIIKYHNIFIGITHGDTIKKNLRDVKEIFVEEYGMEYATAKVKEIHVSHLHHNKESGDVNGCMVRRLSTKAPADAWHTKKGFTMAVKRFMLFEFSRDELLSVRYV